MTGSHDATLRAAMPRGGERRSSPRPSSAGHVVGLALVAILIGVLVGRFLGAGGTEAPVAPAGPEGQIDALRRHLEERPDDAAAWRSLGQAHLQIAVDADDTGHYVAADGAFRRADQVGGGHPDIARGRAVVALGLHHFDVAADLAGAAHEQRPTDPVALAALVDAQVEMGRYDAAERHLQELLDLRPDVASLSRLSYLRQFHGDDAGALEAMLQAKVAAEGLPKEAALIDVLLGEVFFSQGRVAEAGAAFDRARAARPELGDARVGQARVMAAQGDVDGAIDLLAPAMAAAPLEKGWMLLADLYAAAGDGRRAADTVATFTSFVRGEVSKGFGIDSEVPIFLATWGDPTLALELAEDVHAVRPNSTHASQALAWSLLRTGRGTEAATHIEDALRLGTNDARLQYHAAQIFATVGDTPRAAEHLEASLAINPHFSPGSANEVRQLARALGVAAG